MDMLNSFVALTFQLSVPIVLGALCGTIAERGGIILLGVEELPDHSLRVQGLLEPHEMADELWSMLSDPKVVSANILRRDQVWVAGTDYGSVVVVEVPPAERDQLPVYLGGDPFTGSYRRAWDGDYHCTRAEVVAMLGAKEH